ncbi:MAG TPA: cobalamin-binding protein, partial [Actinomycetota bacterium]|nr:cobalamin-binding protein [Actinomycetota bacterium]
MLRGIRWAIVAVTLAASAMSCGGRTAEPAGSGTSPAAGSPASAFPLSITDDEGIETTLEEPPDRIVTFAPSHTEIAFALGVGDRV